jgi:transcriptional regulator with XRE-family HTH domain
MTIKISPNAKREKVLQARTFAEKLIAARNNAQLSQKALADRLGISVQTYNGYETKGYEPKYEILLKICYELDTTPNDLLGYRIDTRFANEYAEKILFNVKEMDNDLIEYTLKTTIAEQDVKIPITLPSKKFNIFVEVSYAMAAALSVRCAELEKQRIFKKELDKQVMGYYIDHNQE